MDKPITDLPTHQVRYGSSLCDQRYALPVLGFLTICAFVADILTSGEYAVPVLYLIPILLSWRWLPNKTGITLAICASLIVLGYVSARPGIDSTPALLNRGLVLVIFGVTALTLWQPARIEADEVDRDRNQLLEERFGRRLAEAALQNAQVRFQSIFESSHDGFAYATFDGAFLEVNSAMEQLTRYSRAELLSMTHRDAVTPDCAAIEEDRRRTLVASRQAVEFELEYITKEHIRVPVCVNMFVVRSRDGEATGLAMIVKDFTERKQTELALRKIAEELHRKNEQLAQANQLLSAAQREAARVHALWSPSSQWSRAEVVQAETPELGPKRSGPGLCRSGSKSAIARSRCSMPVEMSPRKALLEPTTSWASTWSATSFCSFARTRSCSPTRFPAPNSPRYWWKVARLRSSGNTRGSSPVSCARASAARYVSSASSLT